MFRHKDRMLKECRTEKKKNTNKDDNVEKVNFKDLYRFELKAIQQHLIKEGIKVHLNDLRTVRHLKLSEIENKNEEIGNTTIGILLEKLNNNEFVSYGFNGAKVVGKTHDMTRWKDSKQKSLNKKRNREDKIYSQELNE